MNKIKFKSDFASPLAPDATYDILEDNGDRLLVRMSADSIKEYGIDLPIMPTETVLTKWCIKL